jgi:hypothetical protein
MKPAMVATESTVARVVISTKPVSLVVVGHSEHEQLDVLDTR